MTNKQTDRLLDILERFAAIASRWADAEYPIQNEATEATISRVGDRPLPQSVEEYQAFEPQGPSAFEKRLRNQA